MQFKKTDTKKRYLLRFIPILHVFFSSFDDYNSKPATCVLPNRVSSAFSLVEMLMALLVASLLLAALAPVITRRMNDTVNFEGIVANPTRHKVVYLTEPGVNEWTLPDGIRTFNVTTVGAGGGGGAGSNYGCVVFTTTATPTGSLLGQDAKYCEHVRTDGTTNFTIPEGVNEIYVSMISGAGGGGAGSEIYKRNDYGDNLDWKVPEVIKGDIIYLAMSGAGGGGGGSDQGGGGGGAAGAMNGGPYNVAINKTTIPIVIGKGGKGGIYWNTPGAGGAGWKNGENGVTGTSGGGGGGSTSFDNGAITARGGGGGAGQCISNSGWGYGYEGLPNDLWKTVFNYGGQGRYGGTCGPYTFNGKTYGGPSGGNGGDGGNSGDPTTVAGKPGENGNLGDDGRAFGAARGGKGGGGGSGNGNGGYGQDFWHSGGSETIAAGGAGGGGGGSGWGAGSSALTGCKGPSTNQGRTPKIAKAGIGGGGAGASCGWNPGGTQAGGEGGDGRISIRYLDHLYGGTGGQAGVVVPRTHIGMKRGVDQIMPSKTITIAIGKGGKGGDRVIFRGTTSSVSPIVRTINHAGVINENDTTLADANGQPGAPSYIKSGEEIIATTGDGSCAGGYTKNETGNVICTNGVNCGTRRVDGNCSAYTSAWHGHTSASCSNCSYIGTTNEGGASTTLAWDGIISVGLTGGKLVAGNFSARNGTNGSVGHGGSGAYYGGYGGNGGDGYVKIEWGVPWVITDRMNSSIEKEDVIRYSGGGGSAGETITKRVTVSPTVNKIKYKIGNGGAGGSYNNSKNIMENGYDGEDTVFGLNGNYGFNTITAKGGKGGKSVYVNSLWGENYFNIISLTGTHGALVEAKCNIANNCNEAMNGKAGENKQGGMGGTSLTGTGGEGGIWKDGNNTSINGADAISLQQNGRTGGGGGGGGGTSGNYAYGRGGKGANGYIKIEYDD